MKLSLSLAALAGGLSIAQGADDQCSSVSNYDKVDCGFVGVTQQQCETSGCCWVEQGADSTTPWCFHSPTDYSLTTMAKTSTGFEGILKFSTKEGEPAPASTTIQNLKMQFLYETVDTFRVRVVNADSSETDANRGGTWEIPQDVISRPTAEQVQEIQNVDDLNYSVEYQESPFRFQVIRKSDKQVLFDLSKGLTYQDQYISLTTKMADSDHIYGVGESTRLNQALDSGIYTLWAADIAAASFNNNLYGAYPYYLAMTDSGSAHGALLLNSNGMDVILDKDPNAGTSITFKTIGGVIDLYVFSGSTPKAVVKQYSQVIGNPMMVPYWSLGFHNCKYGYTNLTEVEDVVSKYQAADIPLDTQWMDIDYMQNFRDWQWDASNFPQKNVASFVDGLHDQGMHFVPIVDPGIMVYAGYEAYENGVKEGVFVKDVTQENFYLGQVWPGPVHFPDFLHPSTQSYWTDSIKQFHADVKVDGLWIDMNEVSNFCNGDGTGQTCTNPDPVNCPTGSLDTQTTCCLQCETPDESNKYDFPTQYRIHNGQNNGNLGAKTMSPSSWHYGNVSSYNMHNLYGLTEQIATNEALTSVRGERPFLLTRSSFVSSGKHTMKWTGDNAATWEDLKSSIISVLDFNLFGVPMIGADICGFLDATTEELCARWIEVGAFYPFVRNHNSLGEPPQEFYLWESVTQAAQNALGIRYQILPYLYTLFYQAHTAGETVARSLWLNFPSDTATYDIVGQFMLGDGLMVSPVTDEGVTSVKAYFPQGLWYDFQTHALAMDASAGAQYMQIDTPLTSVNVHIYGGTVMPQQNAAMTTTVARTTPYTLVVALCPEGGAYGELFVDDGVQVDGSIPMNLLHATYKASNSNSLVGTIASNSYKGPEAKLPLQSVQVLGVKQSPSSATLNGNDVSFEYDATIQQLTFTVGIAINEAFDLKW